MSAPVLNWLFHALGKDLRRSLDLGMEALKSPRSPFDRSAQSSVGRRTVVPETPRPNLQSQSFSRGYGSILPTSLTYILLSARGCAPWRPEAVMSTTRGANKSRRQIFTDRRERTGQSED